MYHLVSLVNQTPEVGSAVIRLSDSSAPLAGGPRTHGGGMSELQQFPTLPSQPFRLDVPLHELLQRPSEDSAPHPTMLRKAETLPAAVFPQHGWVRCGVLRRSDRKSTRLNSSHT